MIQIKKTILTLVALLAVTTGAWAEEKMVTINSSTMSSGAVTATGFNIFENYLYVSSNTATITTSEGVITKLVIKKGDLYGDGFTEANVGVTPGTITYGSDEITVTDINAESVTLSRKGGDNWSTSSVDVYYGEPTGPKVAWDKAKKTGKFTMPGGNVELEPEYYPQATVTTGGVTAATDVKATTDAELVTIDKSKFTGASGLKYFVGTTDAAPAYTATGWTDKVPTAADITTPGPIYVWYYPVGADGDTDDATFSDGDINATALQVTINPAPTYAVTFADGTPETDKWTASPNTGVSKGTTITVTYTGSEKIIGVKAEKKAAPKTLAEATSEDIGKIAGKDGKIYATKADAEAVATGNAVAMIAYVGTASDCAHGLAIALKDVSNELLTWNNSGNNNESKTAAEWCSAWNTSKAVTGGTWRLPSISDWQYMFIGCGASESYSDNPSQMSYSGLASKLTTAQGDALPVNEDYWSSTKASPDNPWTVLFGDTYAFFYNNTWEGHAFDLVRACLAF